MKTGRPVGVTYYIVHADCMDLYVTTSLEEARRKRDWYQGMYQCAIIYQVIDYFGCNKPIRKIIY